MTKPGRKPDPIVAERNDKIILAAKRGIHPQDIPDEVEGCTPDIVSKVLTAARKSGQAIPVFPSVQPTSLPVKLRRRQLVKLAAYAETRLQSPDECASEILTAVIDDDMFDAVIDDGD